MSDEGTTHLETVTLPPSGYLQPRRYRIWARCNICGQEYNWETEKLSSKNRPCPALDCVEMLKAERAEKSRIRREKMLNERRGPATIGDKVIVKAVDKTAEIVMQDYGMTDLRDNIRQGDPVAPKLPPAQQQKADNFFGTGSVKSSQGARQAELLRRRALAGAFRGMAVNPHITDYGRPAGTSPLSVIRTEKWQ